MRGARTVDVDAPDRADESDGFERVTRLLAGSEQTERRDLRRRDLIDCERRGGADPHAGKSEFVHQRERLGSLDAIENDDAPIEIGFS
jgi:hypothetical protein